MKYSFKLAETESEFAAVEALTHSIFAAELGQYELRAEARIVDKFHHKNTYWVAVHEGQVIGMIALHDQPPFSAAEKLADASVLDKHGKLAEIRLLAVEPGHRNGTVMMGLMNAAYEYACDHDAILISGVVDKAPLYRKLGFRDLGPPVRIGAAEFVPMIAPVIAPSEKRARWILHRSSRAR